MMVSFEPLPREYLQPADPPARLTNFRERWRLLAASGHRAVVPAALPSSACASDGTAVHGAAARGAGARVVVVGHDFRFGRGGEASAQWCAGAARAVRLRGRCRLAGADRDERVSSGRVREALAMGDFAAASDCSVGPIACGAGCARQPARAQARFSDRQHRGQAAACAAAGVFAVRVRRRAEPQRAGRGGQPRHPADGRRCADAAGGTSV